MIRATEGMRQKFSPEDFLSDGPLAAGEKP
jgi:hypothetical protein